MKLHAMKFAGAAAITSALSMLVLSFTFQVGMYQQASMRMQEMHMFYTPTVSGTFTGMIEAAVVTFLIVYVFAWIYNQMLASK